MNYEEKMAELRAKSEHQEAANLRREQQQRKIAAKQNHKKLTISQINRMLDKQEQKIQRRAKQWESKGYSQPVEVAKPDPPEGSN